VRALAELMRRIAATSTAAEQTRLVERDATRLGIAAAAWRELRAARVDLALLRAIHRAVTGGRDTSRYADAIGTWTIARARAGHLRSRAQTFRAAQHREPAWDPATLRRRLADTIVEALALEEPLAQAAALAWTVARAQPFVGDNERVGLVLGARILCAAGLPSLRVEGIERDRDYASALAADAPDVVQAYLERAMWDEARELAESLAVEPPGAGGRWSLADQHATAERRRAATNTFTRAELEAIIACACRVLIPAAATALRAPLEQAELTVHTLPSARLDAVARAARRGFRISPHLDVYEMRWALENAALVLSAGAPGQGLSGAATLHLGMDLGGVVSPRAARALLITPSEDPAERARRIEAWGLRAVEDVAGADAVSADGKR
jgi:hypothetical protein